MNVAGPWIVLAIGVAAVAAAACGDGRERTPGPTREPPANLPVVLQHDVRITASVDDGGFSTELLEPGAAYGDASRLPDGQHRVVFRDGGVVIESPAGEVALAVKADSDPANPLWSPDGAWVMFSAHSGMESTLYLAAADGSALVELGADLKGDAFGLAWAPDSGRLAFGVGGGDPYTTTLHVARAEGSHAMRLGEFLHPQGDGGWDRPQFSPDGSKIAAFGGGLSLRIFSVDGGPAVDVADGQVTKFSWSPDGKSVAFDGDDAASRSSSIHIVDATTGVTRFLTDGFHPRWSPVGDRIAFKRQESGIESSFHAIHPDETGEVTLGPPGYYPFTEIHWSDDGASVSFVQPAFGPAQLYRVIFGEGRAPAVGRSMGTAGSPPQTVVISPDEREAVFLNDAYLPDGGWLVQDLATGASRPLAASTGFPFADVHWSPDGPMVASAGTSLIVAGPGGSTRDLGLEMVLGVTFSPNGTLIAVRAMDGLWIVSTDGSDQRRILELTGETDLVQRVDWSPDGERLTYLVTHSEHAFTTSSIYVSDLDGGRVDVTPDGDYAGLPYWSPDGESIAYVFVTGGTSEMWLMDADGENARMLASLEEGSCCDRIYWSPEGSRIAVAGTSSVWLIDVAAGVATRAVTTASCNVGIAGWSADGAALYAYNACYGGI